MSKKGKKAFVEEDRANIVLKGQTFPTMSRMEEPVVLKTFLYPITDRNHSQWLGMMGAVVQHLKGHRFPVSVLGGHQT